MKLRQSLPKPRAGDSASLFRGVYGTRTSSHRQWFIGNRRTFPMQIIPNDALELRILAGFDLNQGYALSGTFRLLLERFFCGNGKHGPRIDTLSISTFFRVHTSGPRLTHAHSRLWALNLKTGMASTHAKAWEKIGAFRLTEWVGSGVAADLNELHGKREADCAGFWMETRSGSHATSRLRLIWPRDLEDQQVKALSLERQSRVFGRETLRINGFNNGPRMPLILALTIAKYRETEQTSARQIP